MKKWLTQIIFGLSLPLWAEQPEIDLTQAQPYEAGGDRQLVTLGESKKPRFENSGEISWPSKMGEAQVCLWKNDRYAAVSITVDDNNLGNHEFWLKMKEKYNIGITFFLITGRIEGGENKSFNGEWANYQKLIDAGIDIQSHSVVHGKNDNQISDEEATIEYAASRHHLEKNLKGQRFLTLAYPWGKGREEIAQQYYIACRGVNGVPNVVNKTNYGNTCMGPKSVEGIDSILGRPVESPKWLNRDNYKRGWLATLYHYLGNAEAEAKAEEFVSYLDKNKNQLWLGSFTELVLYGQERDSAKIETISSDESAIKIALSDNMKDDLFDYPLTLKIKLPVTWVSVSAVQNTKTLPIQIVEKDNHKFALFDAIPDRGNITLNPVTL